MDINAQNVEQIVRQVLQEMGNKPMPKSSGSQGEIPQKSRAAMLTALEKYEIKEFPIPELGDDDILVKIPSGQSRRRRDGCYLRLREPPERRRPFR